MGNEFETDELVLRLEKEMARKLGTRLIAEKDYDPKIHNKVEMPDQDEENYLQVNAPEGFVLVWDNKMSAERIGRLAEIISFNDLQDEDLISYVCAIAMDEPDMGTLDFIVKCYALGEQVKTSKVINYLGKNRAGEEVIDWMALYIKDCTGIMVTHRDNMMRNMRGNAVIDCQHEIECDLHRSMDDPTMTKSEKYARMLTFSYIAEGLRKEGYDVRPAVMPQYLTAMLQERLRNNYRTA